jgi:cerevisin
MRYSLIAALPALAAASPTFQAETIHNGAAPVLSSTSAKEVPNSYMVVFKKHVKDASKHHDWVQSVHSKNNEERMELRKRSSQFPVTTEIFEGLKHTYEMPGMKGYSGHFDEETIEAIRNHPDVSCTPSCQQLASIHPSQKASVSGVASSKHRLPYLRRQSQPHVTPSRYPVPA